MYTHWNICFLLHLASWLYKLQGQTHLSSDNYQKWMGINTDNKNICFISTKLDKMKSSTVHIIEKLHFIKIFNVLPYWSPNCLLFKYRMLIDRCWYGLHRYTQYSDLQSRLHNISNQMGICLPLVTSLQLFGAFIYHFQNCQSPFQKLTKGHQFLQLENSRNLSSWMLLLKDQLITSLILTTES